MQKLLEEREAAEQELKSLASQLSSRTGADAADAGDMSSLKKYWRENERLQKVVPFCCPSQCSRTMQRSSLKTAASDLRILGSASLDL